MNPQMSILPPLWNLPEAIRNRIGREPGPQRAMLEEGHLLIILHEIPAPDEHERKAALFWRAPNGEWRSNLNGGALGALSDLLRRYDERLTQLEKAENDASNAVQYHCVLENLGPVLRATRGLHRAMQQARELLRADRDLINFRDQAAGVERTAELLLQDAQFGLNFTVARVAESQAATARKMAATAHRLNLLAALFLPITALTSVFGMEIRSGLADSPVNFWGVCAGGILIGVLITAMLSRGK
jgi:hypothetical protein